jgi:superfamily II DNA/RNA helicase
MIVFSATIPPWLKKSVSRYMSPTNTSFINLIGDSQEKTAMNVEHLSFKLNNLSKRPEIVLKLLENCSRDINQSQAIVFCQTKHECDSLARSNQMSSISSDVLHGNLSQRRREQVLQVKETKRNVFLYFCRFFKEFSSRSNSCINNNRCFSTWSGYSAS